MADLNTITMSGRLGADPDMRYLDNGTAVCTLNVANGTYAKGEENNTRTTWYRVTLFGRRAETANELLSKGSYVIIRGEHSVRSYTDKDGNERQANEIRADDFILPPRVRSDAETPQDAPRAPQRQQPRRNVPEPIDDSSLPF